MGDAIVRVIIRRMANESEFGQIVIKRGGSECEVWSERWFVIGRTYQSFRFKREKWLQKLDQEVQGTILLVSHDEEVLRDVCTRIIEVKNKKLVVCRVVFRVFESENMKAKEAQKILERTKDEEVGDVYKYVRRESDSEASEG